MRTVAMNTALADAYAATGAYASVHSADPGSTGADEIVGTTRVAINWQPALNGTVSSLQIAVLVPADETVTHVGIWSAMSGGTFLDSLEVAPTDFAEAGYFITHLDYTQEN